MRFPLFVRSLVSLSASTQYPSDLIANLFDSTLVFHSYQSTMFHTLMGSRRATSEDNMVPDSAR